MGEELDSLSLKELQNLEQQLDTTLKHIRLKKNQLMLESISQFQKKDKELQDQNNSLSKQIKEMEKEIPIHHQNHEIMPAFQLDILRNRNICEEARMDCDVEENLRQNQTTTVLPPWMVQHMNK
ncbi:hypothetical protein L2E82_17040 [Cichorium intybus]|uniref:Uncharacterized protein n=1 Tax=Cichorium intybus TaxID=13427 RepID=A0ACB9F6N5_CICIN|nr:hypothetical protein L2E82_17040 [Cichorium intybus]